MGNPIFHQKIPVISDKEIMVNEPIIIGEKEYKMTCLSMGNPHAVVFVENTDDIPH